MAAAGATLSTTAASTTTASTQRGRVVIDNAVKVYGSGKAAVLAVDDCSLIMPAGEICMIVGPSGCGKTTLLNAVAGFHDLTSGCIFLDGAEICGPSCAMATPGPDRVVVFQNGALFPWKTVLENVAFGPVVQGRLSAKLAREKARQLLAESGLDGTENNYPGELSSGMTRRVEIIRAQMNDPSVLLLDEPYRALDSLTRSVMHEALLEAHARQPVTIMFITHDLEEAVLLGHRVVVMTARPCRTKLDLRVDIPFPRGPDVLTSRRYRDIVDAALAAVQEEARLSFAANEREGG